MALLVGSSEPFSGVRRYPCGCISAIGTGSLSTVTKHSGTVHHSVTLWLLDWESPYSAPTNRGSVLSTRQILSDASAVDT
jgi:hypothetical protein